MSNEPEFTDLELTNIAKGFDAPAKPDLLEQLKEQAREREIEMNQEKEPDKEQESKLDEFYRKRRERDRDGRDLDV